ncbi:hypothetical protein PR003_g8174 [Phytophthora rubi]|uniref:Uncharacterized protein n=1 Tax=Phytophthora rubi TaxID=129364 RepID=A0A6A3NE51_9STRA|nr:hypothetical protein PR002_g18533 [Phytophthora rubi]KAE9039264.1 hypothetical protein PR001_g7577 [Phytophthora rubi]KAE9344979.1 hypothetical protein PR003_g8174 [Phytophthora rubi]
MTRLAYSARVDIALAQTLLGSGHSATCPRADSSAEQATGGADTLPSRPRT